MKSAFTLLFCLSFLCHADKILYKWDFNVPGQKLSKVKFNEDFENSITIENGAYRIRRGTDGPPNTYTDALDLTSSVVYLRIDIRGWNLVGKSDNEALRIGFTHTNPNDYWPRVKCHMFLKRIGKTRVAFGGESFFSDDEKNTMQKVLFKNKQLAKASFVLMLVNEYRMHRDKYKLYYNIGEGFVELGSSSVDPTRDAKYLRLGAYGEFNSTKNEFLDIDRILITTDYNVAFHADTIL